MPLWLYGWTPKDQEIKKESGAQAFTPLLPVSMSGLFCYIPNLSKRLLSFFLVFKWGGDQSAFLFLSVYLLAVHAQHWPFAILRLSVNVLLGGDGHLSLEIQLLHAFFILSDRVTGWHGCTYTSTQCLLVFLVVKPWFVCMWFDIVCPKVSFFSLQGTVWLYMGEGPRFDQISLTVHNTFSK